MQIKDLTITSPDIGADGWLSDRHALEGGNIPPRMRISGVPEDAVELAVICHDPDAPLPHGFTHWALYGVPTDTTEIGPQSTFRSGLNDFRKEGYGGPRPPVGHGRHYYYFWVYALSRPVRGTPARQEFLEGYADAIIEQNRIVGVYER
ncbi:YbhB/YbcL family Raf kinase inhibitor-like protein [Hoyosella rhizosphaerae]|uniref:PEBP family protein n=1 Tax=Hoyosella rhizosphaerae TaxID=1755582 RepID=A0A916XGH6_9ACTN|nr:YbhB/YbcL family Raf kinase inhibitor-like protein [Hoyosella rhizosphaerae]MBN4925665.1 YbhB/YbcL family Raf kinase inhibitor-like protein [Hoyosella rhizosphaerae]GGC68845.1 PEBP family protein [Hoyosella rhizosphaerae]